VVSFTPLPLYPWRNSHPIAIVWAPEPVWKTWRRFLALLELDPSVVQTVASQYECENWEKTIIRKPCF
jgi:hypothetical protein